LMNVSDQATLPGSARYKIKSCFILGTGYGDLSAERVYLRVSRMSCVDKNNKLILSQDIAGYVVDSDGKLGMRGKVVDRQGAKLGAAMLAGFAQGLSGALGSSQGTSTSSAAGVANTLTGTGALRASGLAGAQSATSQLAEFYLKEAQSIFPVISVDTGRTGTIVFTSSVALNWTHGDTPFVQELKPN
jgi:conjugal transfer pilus assembly protein TraB